MEKGDKMVTIATFSESTLAYVLKGRLESDGIPCLVADGNIVPHIAFFSDNQGIRVQVLEKDKSKALAVIESIEK